MFYSNRTKGMRMEGEELVICYPVEISSSSS